jgi:hypothetical protein
VAARLVACRVMLRSIEIVTSEVLASSLNKQQISRDRILQPKHLSMS